MALYRYLLFFIFANTILLNLLNDINAHTCAPTVNFYPMYFFSDEENMPTSFSLSNADIRASDGHFLISFQVEPNNEVNPSNEWLFSLSVVSPEGKLDWFIRATPFRIFFYEPKAIFTSSGDVFALLSEDFYGAVLTLRDGTNGSEIRTKEVLNFAGIWLRLRIKRNNGSVYVIGDTDYK